MVGAHFSKRHWTCKYGVWQLIPEAICWVPSSSMRSICVKHNNSWNVRLRRDSCWCAGDSNVPAGEVSFRAAIGSSKQLPPASHMEMLGVTCRFKGEGHIARSGFTNPRCTSFVSQVASRLRPDSGLIAVQVHVLRVCSLRCALNPSAGMSSCLDGRHCAFDAPCFSCISCVF